MQVRILVCMAGVDFVRNVGDVVEVDEREGRSLLAAGFAEAVNASPPIRSRPAERAVSRAATGREKGITE